MTSAPNMLLKSLMFFSLLVASGSSTLQAQESSDEMELRLLFSSLNDNTLNSDFFLAETLIVGEQREKLQTFVSDLRSRVAKISLRKVDDKSVMEIEKELIQERTKAFGELKSILMPHQIRELRSLFHQRSMLSRFGCESFQLPNLILQSLDCPTDVVKETSKKLKTIEDAFFEKKRTAFEAALSEGLSELDKDQMHQLRESLLISSTIARNVQRLKLDAPISGGIQQYEEFENRLFDRTTIRLWSNADAKKQLSISEEQAIALEECVRASSDTIDRASRISVEDRTRLRKEMKLGNQEAIAEFRRKKLQREDMVIEQVANDCRSILLPLQNEALEKSVTLVRASYEAKLGDKFGLVAAWLRNEIGDSKAKKLLELRQQYYTELETQREKAEKEVLASLPDVSSKKFTATFGSFYDYQGELRSRIQGNPEAL